MKTLNIVITSGGTSEYIDAVRKITNSGTGKLGSIIAEQISKNENINKIFYIYTTKAIYQIITLIYRIFRSKRHKFS